MIRERLDNWCEKAILGLALAILVFGPLATGAVRTLEFLIIQGLTILVIALWTARFWLRPTYRLLWTPVCWAVLLFVGYAIARCQFAPIEFLARNELIRVLIYAFLFFAVLNNLHRQESAQWVALVLVFLAMTISLYAIYQFLTGSKYVWHFIKPDQYLNRGSGTYICPNNLAGFLEMILPLGLAYLLASRLSPVKKVFLGYASLVILCGIGVSLSRGGWLATGGSLFVFLALLLRKRGHRLLAIVLLVILAGAVFGFVRQTQRAEERFKKMFIPGQADDSLARLALWRPAWRMWQDHFWWGVGPGHFDARFDQYRPPTIQLRGQWVHNDYLNTLTDWGLVGAGLVVAAWMLLFAGVFRTWKFVAPPSDDLIQEHSNRSAFVFGGSIGLLAILMHSFVDFNMQIPANAILAITLMALLSSTLRFASDRYWVTLGSAGKIMAALIGLAGAAYLGQQAIHRADEYVWLERARRATNSTEQTEAMKRACAAEPRDFEASYNLGEILRRVSWRGNDDYRDLAEAAMTWFKRGMASNPYDQNNFLGYGMCLDWLGRHTEAEPYFRHALDLDPNGWRTIGRMGWHYFQVADYPNAKVWFERSVRFKALWPGEPMAAIYLRILQQRMAEPPRKP